MKLTNILAVNLLSSILVINSFCMKKSDNNNSLTKYIKTENALINTSDILGNYLMDLDTDQQELVLSILDSLKLETLPELINKDLVKISNYIDIERIKEISIKLCKEIKLIDSNKKLKEEDKNNKKELIITLNTNKILNECIKKEAICKLLNINEKKINEFVNLEKTISSILNYFISNKSNFDNLFTGIETEKIERKLAFPKGSLKLCFSKPSNEKEKEDIDNIRTNLAYITSESCFNEAKFYQFKGFTFTTLAILFLWYAGHAINHELMESFEPQSFIFNTLLTLMISWPIYKIFNDINTSPIHPNTFFLLFIGLPIINDFILSNNDENKDKKEKLPRIFEVEEDSKENGKEEEKENK